MASQAAFGGVQIGRVQAGRAPSPFEAGYVQAMNGSAKQITKILEDVIKRFHSVTPDAIVFALKPIMKRSQELVPIDTGALKRSGFIEIRKRSQGTARVVIGYGKGGRPPYAAFVHEALHIRHAKGKQAKFLEAAVNEKMPQFTSRLIKYMQTNTGIK